MEKHDSIRDVRWLCVTAVFMAMTIVLSMSIFSIPVPGGHLYLCDVIICTAALVLNPLPAFCVGGIGSFLGDLLFYPAPMFVSLAAHGLQAIVISRISHGRGGRRSLALDLLAVIVGSVVMVALYTLGRAYVYATPEYAVIKLPYEILQAVIGAAAALLLRHRAHVDQMLRRR